MSTGSRQARSGDLVVNVGLGAVFALGTAFTGYMLMDSWGGDSWVLDCVVSVVVSVLALLRAWNTVLTAGVGLVVAAGAAVLSLVGELPQEPGPVASLGLAVLVGSALRNLPAAQAAVVGGGGAGVVGVAWVSGWTGVTNMTTMVMVGAFCVGLALRRADRS